MKRLSIVAALIAVPLFAGCNSTTNVSSSSSTSSSAETQTSESSSAESSSTDGSASSSESPAASESSETSAASDGSSLTKPFGSTFTWDDKLAVTVSKPVPFTPSEYAVTDSKFKKFVKLTVVIKNGTDKVYESFNFNESATSGDQQTDKVFDSAKGIELPTAKILPGKSLTYNVAYGYTPGQDYTLTVNSMDRFDRADGIYSGKL